jgi:hypothetical protein
MVKTGLFQCAANALPATNAHRLLRCRPRVQQASTKIKLVKLLASLAQPGQHAHTAMPHLIHVQLDTHLQQIKHRAFLNQLLAATLRLLLMSLLGPIKEPVFYVLKVLNV